MPRTSSAALAVAPINPRSSPPRPRQNAPPEVAALFTELVRAAPADHFKAGDGVLLELYAQALLLSRLAFAHLEADGPVTEDAKPSPWLAVLEKAHRSAAVLSGRLRLAPSARADSRSAGRRADGPTLSYYQTLDESDAGH